MASIALSRLTLYVLPLEKRPAEADTAHHTNVHIDQYVQYSKISATESQYPERKQFKTVTGL